MRDYLSESYVLNTLYLMNEARCYANEHSTRLIHMWVAMELEEYTTAHGWYG
jgi:hypothetical protein